MASNKDSNSSKTAHVMSLLSKNRGASAPETAPAAKEAEAEAAAPAAAPAAPPGPAAPTAPPGPHPAAQEADAAVSSQIKDALEVELDLDAASAKPEPPKAAPAPASQPPAEELSAVSADELMGVPDSQAAPVPPAPEMDLPAPEEEAPEEAERQYRPAYTNVMQVLVDEKAEKYMKMFGICCCEHCQVDVKAYALNHLPPKYVVMAPDERVPKLTVYESKYSSDITAQLIQACKVVMNTPHHTRSK